MKRRHELIAQRLHQCDDLNHKHALLNHLLKDTAVYQAIVFTATKRSADKLAGVLGADQGVQAAALHGDLRQGARNRIVERLRRGKLRVLVATDVAARGLDFSDITHVINFDLPMVPEDYVHRIGRTGRAGSAGTAISLIGPNDRAKIAHIERLLGYHLDRETIPGLEPRRSEPLAGRHPQKPARPGTPHRGHASQKSDTHHRRWNKRSSRAQHRNNSTARTLSRKPRDL
ncbi:MAG: helicase-related protein [Gammaproteobacteria bacterium]